MTDIKQELRASAAQAKKLRVEAYRRLQTMVLNQMAELWDLYLELYDISDLHDPFSDRPLTDEERANLPRIKARFLAHSILKDIF